MRSFSLVIPLLALMMASCTHRTPAPATSSKTKSLILIHGSHFDDTAWSFVAPELQDTPYEVKAIRLLGRAEDEHATLTEMAENVCHQISKSATIVAHSFGGAVVSQMIGLCPAKIEKVIYVSALIPLKREKSFDIMGQSEQRAYEKAVKFGQSRIAPGEPKIFYRVMDADLNPEKLPKLKLYSESYGPGQDRINFDDALFGKIPKYYIFTTKDQIVSLPSQQKYTQRTPMVGTAMIESGHLPMLSKPAELAKIIRSFLN